MQINNNSNAINVYLVNNAVSYAGKADGILSQALVIENNYAETHITSHEMGHCFNLWHTFHGSSAEPASSLDPNACAENTSGSNCQTCGDYVCDTPADANVGVSQGYTPNLDNIMSYYYPFDHFTNGQNRRIHQAFASYSVLQQTVSNSCSIPTLTGSNTICNSNTTYTLQNGSTNVSWQVSSNLQIISSSNTAITVKPIDQFAKGEGFITAILPFQNVKREVWIGTPDIYTMDFNGNKNYFGETYHYPVSHSTRTVTVHSDYPNATFSWSMHPNNIQWTSHGNTATFYINTQGNYVLTAQTENDCGTHRYFISLRIGSEDNGDFSTFRVAQNPITTNAVVIEQTDVGIKEQSKIKNRETIQIDLLDFKGTLVKSKTLKGNNVEKKYQLEIEEIKNGTYFVRILFGNYNEIYQIIINKK